MDLNWFFNIFETKEHLVAMKLGLRDEGFTPSRSVWKANKHGWGGFDTSHLEHSCGTRIRKGCDKSGKRHIFCSECKVVLGEYELPGWYGYKLPLKKSKVDPYPQ